LWCWLSYQAVGALERRLPALLFGAFVEWMLGAHGVAATDRLLEFGELPDGHEDFRQLR
jgi:hypothetical protein